MIVFIEGLSTTGKTYLVNKLLEEKPDWIRFKGAGAVKVGMQQRWQEYNFWMHNIIERLDEINKYEKVILWDRGLTDAIYSKDKNYRKEILRVAKSHIKKCAIFIKISEEDWPVLAKMRNSKEGGDFKLHKEKYDKVLSSFSLLDLRLDKKSSFNIESEHIHKVVNFIDDRMES